MADKNYTINIVSESSDAQKDISKLINYVDELKKSSEKTNSEMEDLGKDTSSIENFNERVDELNNSVKDLNTTMSNTTGINEVKSSTDNLTKSMNISHTAILENGGAMGLLSNATGGLAMDIKDGFEAMQLFTVANIKKTATTAKDTVVTAFNTVANKLYTVVTGEATVATVAFQVALLSLVTLGVGAVILGIVAAYKALTSASKEAEEANKKIVDSLEQQSNMYSKLNKDLSNFYEEELKYAELRGASEKEIQDLKEQGLKKQIKNSKDELNDLRNKYRALNVNAETYKEDQDKLSQEIRNKEKEVDDYKHGLKLSELDFKIATNKKIVDDEKAASKKILDDQKAARDKRAEQLKKEREELNAHYNKLKDIYERYIDQQEDLSDKTEIARLERANKRAQEELKLEYDSAVKGVKNSVMTKEEKNKALLKLSDDYNKASAEIDKTYSIREFNFLEESNKSALSMIQEFSDTIRKNRNDRNAEDAKAQQDNLDLQHEQEFRSLEEELSQMEVSEETKQELRQKLAEKQIDDQANLNEILLQQQRDMTIAEIELQQSRVDAAANTAQQLLSIVGAFNGKSKSLQKGLIIADAAISVAQQIMSTKNSIMKIVAKYSGIPGGQIPMAAEIAAVGIQGAASVATTYKAADNALKQIGAGGSVGNSGGGGGNTAPSFNIVGQSGTNSLNETIAGQSNNPIRTYVTSGEVTTQQALDRSIISNSTFG